MILSLISSDPDGMLFLKHKSHKRAQKEVENQLLCPFVTFVFQKFGMTPVCALCICAKTTQIRRERFGTNRQTALFPWMTRTMTAINAMTNSR